MGIFLGILSIFLGKKKLSKLPESFQHKAGKKNSPFWGASGIPVVGPDPLGKGGGGVFRTASGSQKPGHSTPYGEPCVMHMKCCRSGVGCGSWPRSGNEMCGGWGDTASMQSLPHRGLCHPEGADLLQLRLDRLPLLLQAPRPRNVRILPHRARRPEPDGDNGGGANIPLCYKTA